MNISDPGESLAELPLLPQAMYSNSAAATLQTKPDVDPNTLKRKRVFKSHRIPRKKQKVLTSSENDEFPKSPNAIIFARSRIFYARPARTLRGRVVFGLRKERKNGSDLN